MGPRGLQDGLVLVLRRGAHARRRQRAEDVRGDLKIESRSLKIRGQHTLQTPTWANFGNIRQRLSFDKFTKKANIQHFQKQKLILRYLITIWLNFGKFWQNSDTFWAKSSKH